MRIVWSKYRHSAGRFLLFLLIMSTAILFLSLAFQLYMLSVQSAQQVEKNTVTIAITPTQVSQEEILLDMTEEEVYALWAKEGPGSNIVLRSQYSEDKADFVSRAYLRKNVFTHVPASEMAPGSSAILGEHDTRTMAGYFPGSKTLAVPFKEKAYERQVITYDSEISSTEAIALFTITITKVRRLTNEELSDVVYEVNGEEQAALSPLFEFEAKVDEVHVLNQDLGKPENILLRTNVTSEAGYVTLKAGDTAVVFGRYEPRYDELPLLDQTVDLGPYTPEVKPVFRESAKQWFHYRVSRPETPLIMAVDDERVAFMTEAASLNSGMLFVTGIERTECLPLFGLNEAYITQGRDISAEELAQGANVCLLNEQFALRNGLTVGDKIDLSLYENTLSQVDAGIENRLQSYVYHQDYLLPSQPAAKSAPFTVIGLFHSPLWLKSEWAFTPNTVFVPVTALPDGEKTTVAYAESTILHNGMADQFRLDASDYEVPRDPLDAADTPEQSPYTLCDGDYDAFMDSLAAMRADSGFVLLVCAILYAVLILSAASMMTRHLGGDALLMLKVGATRGRVRRYIWGCTLPVAMIAAGIAYAACALIQSPLLDYLETWYALAAPRFSNLPDTSGVMAAMGQRLPSPLGTLIALVSCWAVLFILTETTLRERRTR